MRRKLLLPALAACTMLAISAPVATANTHKAHAASLGSKLSAAGGAIKGLQKAVANIVNVNLGQTSSIHDVDLRVDKVVATLAAVTAGVPAIVDGLTALKAGLTTVGAGLTSLAAAVQGYGIAGQLGAAGTAAPGNANTATPSSLPTGTVYRQIVLATGGALNTAPIGARTWVRLPDVAAVGYSNTYVCTSAGTSPQAFNVGGSGHGYDLTCSGGDAAFGH